MSIAIDDAWVHLITPDERALKAQSPGGWIIFTGPDPCTAAVTVAH